MKSRITKVLFILLLFSAKISPAAEEAKMYIDFGLLVHLAIHNGKKLREIESLLVNNGNVNAQCPCGKSPLMLAAINGRKDVFALLLKYNANPWLRDPNGYSAFCYTEKDMLEPLEEEDMLEPLEEQNSPICLAIMNDESFEKIRSLLASNANVNEKNSDGYSLLMLASNRNRLDIVELLLKYNVNFHDENTQNGHSEWYYAATQEIRTLLEESCVKHHTCPEEASVDIIMNLFSKISFKNNN